MTKPEDETWTGKVKFRSGKLTGPSMLTWWGTALVLAIFIHLTGVLDVIEFHPENVEHLRTWWDNAPAYLTHIGGLIAALMTTITLARKLLSELR